MTERTELGDHPDGLEVPDRSGAASPLPAPAAPRRAAADPVKALLHRHRDLCERAVDPLEIAAGLEAHGMTDRTAARFRHRDVFSLAEELYARVPRDGDTAPWPNDPTGRPNAPGTYPGAHPSAARSGATARPPYAGALPGSPYPRARTWAPLALLPGTLCAAALVGLRLTEGRPRLAVGAAGVLAVALGLHAALGRGPLHSRYRTRTVTYGWTCWLLAYAFLGDGFLTGGLPGGPDRLWHPATASLLALALACAPAAFCAHLLAAGARRRLATSRALTDFASSLRPLLLGVFTLFLCALGALLALCGPLLGEPTGIAAYAGAWTLGALLLLARLLTAHGFTRAPAPALATAGTVEAVALTAVHAAHLPYCSSLATPVERLVGALGATVLPALTCGGAALVLLVHAMRRLTRASAHAHPGEPPTEDLRTPPPTTR
ncbi:hypothetical protein OK074_6051 [Actinobacteria bacterium OK074]|nr:hypothetical protein OK074_6051 [Actinobacteria bacterium OK074]